MLTDTSSCSLHSLAARQQMRRYRIGKVQGRWKNFVPPIQGGKFRPYKDSGGEEIEREGVEAVEELASDSSRPPSPVFDVEEGELRRRQPSASSSASSVTEPEDGMSFIDVYTKQQVDLDHSKYPSLDQHTQDEIVRKYRQLGERIRDERLYDCNYSAYAMEGVRYTFLACMTLMFLRLGWYTTSAVFLGCLWHQLVFTVHDAGHMGITHNFHVDTVIGIIIADFIGGLSVCWWKHNHNVHHIVTNSPEHDPDIEHMPFFAITPRFFTSLKSTFYNRVLHYDAMARFFLPYQAYMYYPLLLFGRFNLYFLSWEYIIRGLGPKRGPAWWHRWLEAVGQVFFWTWFGYGILYKAIPSGWDRFVFLMVSHMVTMPVHAQITLSHFSMSTSELGPDESFPQKMLRTTMDVDCPPWLDFFHGGLQFQAIHHLFPRIPRHNLRRTRELVQEFCAEVGIPYALYGFVDANKDVIGRLGEVARQASILAKCERTNIEKGELFHGHY